MVAKSVGIHTNACRYLSNTCLLGDHKSQLRCQGFSLSKWEFIRGKVLVTGSYTASERRLTSGCRFSPPSGWKRIRLRTLARELL